METTDWHIATFERGHLEVGDGHSIHYCVSGNPSGVPVIHFHGGPGSSSKASQLGRYDLEVFKVIQFDQRGCGLSEPAGSITSNTLSDLVSDTEKIRMHLGFEKWIVSGGSWGGTLGLVYAQAHPDVIQALYVQSPFLGRLTDKEWLFGKRGAARFFPELWQVRADYADANDLLVEEVDAYLFDRLKRGSLEEQKQAVVVYNNWEGNMVNLTNDFHFKNTGDVEEEDIKHALIFFHYATQNFFLTKNQILANIEKIKHIPAAFVHGRYDFVCTPEQSYLVHKQMQNSKHEFVNYAGHRIDPDGHTIGKYMMIDLLKRSQ